MMCLVVSGISEMFKTPVNERKRRSVINDNNTTKTPVAVLGMSVVEPSLLNTPEEPGKVYDNNLTDRESKHKAQITFFGTNLNYELVTY